VSAPIVLLFAVDLSESFLCGAFFAMIWFVAKNYGALALWYAACSQSVLAASAFGMRMCVASGLSFEISRTDTITYWPEESFHLHAVSCLTAFEYSTQSVYD
jgi:hypothetical protein